MKFSQAIYPVSLKNKTLRRCCQTLMIPLKVSHYSTFHMLCLAEKTGKEISTNCRVISVLCFEISLCFLLALNACPADLLRF